MRQGKSNKFTEAFYDLFNASATHAIRSDVAAALYACSQATGDQKFSMESLREAAPLIMREDEWDKTRAAPDLQDEDVTESGRGSCLGLAWIKRLY